ncbi:hypothetical protein HHI36_005459 [Cryptolaemus montrouzieri]|uniref:Uncharacterized protein n=1 Tax=Cryptolaemus montrouzieri TaxID=559131 RepID=A0ABD2NUA0_9CUCU
MGNLMAKPQEPEFSSSDVSEEENDISLDSDGTILHSTLSQRPVCITLSDVREMESNLEEYEKVECCM